jgi:trehalose utilization protein
MSTRVMFWNEFRHEKSDAEVQKVYPDGLHAPIVAHLRAQGFETGVATLDEPEHGLTESVLAATDVLVWWGHMAHEQVQEAIVDRVQQRILDGMGLIVLHSAHYSKIFRRLMGSTCNLKWREDGEKERMWVASPGHPITAGLGDYFEIPREEMYGEYFDIPQPNETVFISWFAGGEVFRSGVCFQRGKGRVFYFRPGHETYPTYYQPEVQRVIANAVHWAAPQPAATIQFGHFPEPIEPIL